MKRAKGSRTGSARVCRADARAKAGRDGVDRGKGVARVEERFNAFPR